jgi:hypothetical protein
MKIEFEEATHTYQIDGKVVPSVTQCLALLDPFQKVDRHILEAARDFGQKGHRAMALLIRDKLDWNTLDPALKPYVLSGAKFLGDFAGHTVIASEAIVGDKVLGVAGCIDLVMENDRLTEIVEFKFTAQLPDAVGPQTAAYAKLWFRGLRTPRALTVRRRCVVLGPDGYKTYLLTDPADWADFLSCLNVTKRRRKYGIE